MNLNRTSVNPIYVKANAKRVSCLFECEIIDYAQAPSPCILNILFCFVAMFHPPLLSRDSLRLLDILPAATNAPIETVLVSVTLRSTAPLVYDALSYVWGPASDRVDIQCNGQTVSITQSLAEALLHLRSDTDKRTLWIDQLCINQEDTGERNQQVTLMGDIYSLARKVVVWLGPSDDETITVWTVLQKVSELQHFEPHEVYDLPRKKLQLLQAPESRLSSPGYYERAVAQPKLSSSKDLREFPDLPAGDAPEWKAVEQFLQRPWFSRMWTYQEVVLSRICIVHCGSYSMSWSDLSDSCKAITYGGYNVYIDEINHRVSDIQVQRLRSREGKSTTFRSLLERNRFRNATEPRDMVYALRGIVDQSVAEVITVAYSSSLADVYAYAVKACIIKEEALTVLGSVEYRRSEESRTEMPSWVPDWRFGTSIAVDLSMRRSDGARYFSCSENETPRMTEVPSTKTLVLKGFVLATLTRFSNIKQHLGFDIYRMRARRFSDERFEHSKWREMYSTAAANIAFPYTSLKQRERANMLTGAIWNRTVHDDLDDEQSIEMAYRRTVTADLFPGPHSRLNAREIEEGFPAYTAWKQSGFTTPVPTEVLHEHDYYVTQVMSNREFFVAEDGQTSYMGITMGVPRAGDCVCVLLGGDVPFVMRPKGVEWQFLAEAYVHGIMDGEAMSKTREPGFEYKDFVIT